MLMMMEVCLSLLMLRLQLLRRLGALPVAVAGVKDDLEIVVGAVEGVGQ
jgi:hypothetical protein